MHPQQHCGALKRSLVAAVLTTALAGVLSASAAAYTCTDNFTGPNEGQWSTASNWSTDSIPGETTTACWPDDITVVDSSIVGVGSIHGGGLTISTGALDFYHGAEAGTSSLSGALSVIGSSYLSEAYTPTPVVITLGGPLIFSGGQISNITIVQGPGTSVSIPAAASVPPDLDPGSSITTESPVTIGNSTFETGGTTTSVTTTSTITLAPGLSLGTEGNDGTFTAAGIGPNTGPKYGFGADALVLTGGTTSVASGNTLESGPLNIHGGVLEDNGTVGQASVLGNIEPTPTTLAGGTLSGTGTVAGPLTNSGGTVSPGDVLGSLTVAGNYTQEAGGTLGIGIAGTTPGTEFDQLLVGGSATLGGTLSLVDEGGFAPVLGDTFKIISGASSRTGTFAAVGGPSAGLYGVEYNPDGATLTSNAPPVVTKATAPSGGSSSAGTSTTSAPSGSTGIASTPKAIEELRLGCTNTQLVLNDVYIRGNRVLLSGSAASSLVGKKVKILFGTANKQVASATVAANGQFTTTAPLPPVKIRDSDGARYTAESGKLRSLHLKLTRRLLLEAPTASGTTVTLSGQVTLPLTKPIAPVTVKQELECGKTTIAKTFTPSASGRYRITLTVPTNAKAAIFRLTSKVAANEHSVKHGFTTYSLPLPVTLG
jgi:hypothetical protein